MTVRVDGPISGWGLTEVKISSMTSRSSKKNAKQDIAF
jgi:hypothetical protein